MSVLLPFIFSFRVTFSLLDHPISFKRKYIFCRSGSNPNEWSKSGWKLHFKWYYFRPINQSGLNCSKWAITGLFFFTFVFSKTRLTINKFADDWNRTGDLWCWKRPLYQLSHNYCPRVELLKKSFCSIRSTLTDEKNLRLFFQKYKKLNNSFSACQLGITFAWICAFSDENFLNFKGLFGR